MIDQWINKQLREGCFMPFGSMMNAYGQINKGKDIDAKKFLKDSMGIFEHAQLMVRKAILSAEEISEPEVVEPVKTGIDKTWEQRKFHKDLMQDDDKEDYQRTNK